MTRIGANTVRLVVTGLFIVLVFFAQFMTDNNTLSRLDGIGYDAKLQLMPPLPETVANIQIVDIDERSLFEIERMPWRRSLYAELTHKLNELGAIVIAFDVLFSEPQTNPALPVLTNLKTSKSLVSANSKAIEGVLKQFDYDAIFADAINKKDVVFGTLLHHQADLKKGQLNANSILQSSSEQTNQITRYLGYSGVIDVLAESSTGQGFMNSVEDADGFVRRAALLAKVDGIFYPSLAAEAFRVYSFAEKLEPLWQRQGDITFLEGIRIGTSIVPTDNAGQVLVPFKGPAKTYPYTSAADVLKDKVDPEQFNQAVVFVGTSAAGLADLRVTPVTVNFPGVEVHATVFEALLAPENLIYRPDWWQGALAVQLVVTALLIVFSFPRLGPLFMSVAALLMVGLAVAINLYLWRYQSIDIPIVSPLLLTITLSIYFIASGFFSESQRRRRVKAIFDQYVPPAHIDRLLESAQQQSLDGEKKVLSVMFSDIRSFTSISETMTAQDLKRWLNQFFSPITKVIFQNDGTIDKYVGDMVMAFWGAPLEDAEHANKSVLAAFQMLDALESLNAEFTANNLPIANIGIGINTGEMNVGDMGSDYRRSYTVLGDAVNLGSRLEGLTKFYGLTILVSEFTQAQATNFEFLLVDKVKVKGKQEPVTIYTPLPKQVSDSQQHHDNAYSQAIDAYYSREFESALSQFEVLDKSFRFPVLVTLYLERTRHWIQNPPESDWDGSYTHTSK